MIGVFMAGYKTVFKGYEMERERRSVWKSMQKVTKKH